MVFLLINKIFYGSMTSSQTHQCLLHRVLEEEKNNDLKVYFKEVLLSWDEGNFRGTFFFFFFFNSSVAVVGYDWLWSSSLMLCNCFVWWDLVWLQYIRSFMLMRLLKLYPPPYRGMGFPDGASGEEPTCQCRRQRDASSIPGSGRSPGGGHGNLLQYCCLASHGQRNLAGYVGSIGSQRVGHDWSNLACMHLCTHVKE